MFRPLDWLLGLFSLDIGIDLGTANTLVSVRDRGIVINEPSWVAINKRSRKPLAIGAEAREMVGRTPSHIVAIRRLRDGVISEFDITEEVRAACESIVDAYVNHDSSVKYRYSRRIDPRKSSDSAMRTGLILSP